MTLTEAAKGMAQWCTSLAENNLAGYLIILLLALLGYRMVNQTGAAKHADEYDEDDNPEVEPPEPKRNFTISQLRKFDGTMDEKMNEPKAVYLALRGTVFDVSKGRDFYGPGGPYEAFAGRECGVALAKMSFEEEHLDDVLACEDLGVGDRTELENWMEKFEHYRCYPILGKVVPKEKIPSPDRIVSIEELAKNVGTSDEIPDGYGAAPIYLGAQDKVFDVSFGGVPMYGKDGPYHRFAGKDASRALALMSFDPKDADNPDVSDLNEKQLKVLGDWVKTFEERKEYACVGKLEK